MEQFGSALVAGLVSGAVISTVIGLATRKRTLRLENTIRSQFEQLAQARQSEWALLQEVLGPATAHIRRTKMAFTRWSRKNLFLEQAIIADSNTFVRDLLLSRYHLLTPELRPHADELVQHYDRWLEEFERQRETQNPEEGTAPFVFVGPKGYPFPREAEKAFNAALDETYTHLVASRSVQPA